MQTNETLRDEWPITTAWPAVSGTHRISILWVVPKDALKPTDIRRTNEKPASISYHAVFTEQRR